MLRRLRATVLIVLLVLAGCGEKSTSNGGVDGGPIATEGMRLRVDVEAGDESTVSVTARLDDGNAFGDQYVLTGGDTLRACVDTQCADLSRLHSSTVKYGVSLPYREDTDYVISFIRPIETEAPQTSVRLPPPFDLLSPTNGDVIHEGETTTVAWSPAGTGEIFTFETSGSCRYSRSHSFTFVGYVGSLLDSGAGARSFDADELIHHPPSPVTRCDFDLTASTERDGSIDPVFRTGSITGRAIRSVSLVYVH